jgi:hypothetical protein
MLDKKQAEEILRALIALPAEKVSEAQDFILFLRERYGQQYTIDESDVWTDEDLRDLAAASFAHLDQLFPE